nr:MAG TPA: hypothetical protein [Caudoviricetes sp.]
MIEVVKFALRTCRPPGSVVGTRPLLKRPYRGYCVGAVDRVDWRHAKRMRQTERSRINITRVE